MHIRHYISFLILLFSCSTVFAQLEHEAGAVRGLMPDSWTDIKIDKSLLSELSGKQQSKDESFQFAIPVPVELNPSNAGSIIIEGDEEIWVLGIRSEGALSLNLMLSPFNLPEGAYVYIFNSSVTDIAGAFTVENNLDENILSTVPVAGSEIILECHFPVGADMTEAIGVSQVAHDYYGILGNSPLKDGRFDLSQSCNIDVNCIAGIGTDDIKRSVCRLLVNGTELCTGVMVNNTNEQNIPYLITAQHCIGSKLEASKTIFLFGYESPWCNGPDGRTSHSISGSSLISTNDEIDFSLVKLSVFPPLYYKPYLAGWDVSGTVPVKTSTIHHPQGDVKKISFDNNPPVSSSFGTFTPNGFWKILQWDGGTTEPGSSGAPLFDQNNRVAGLLSGGDAVCGRSVDDYFAKLSLMYSLSVNSAEKLSTWINPSRSSVTALNGRDPYATNSLTNDTLYNIHSDESVLSTGYVLPAKGFLTGFNSDSITGYAEYFTNIRELEITEVWINIASSEYVTTADSIRIYVFADGVKPVSVLASKRIYIKETKDTFLLKVDFDRTIHVTGNFYVGWKLWYGARASSEIRQLAVFNSPARVTSVSNTAWFLKNGLWSPFFQHPSYPVSMSLDVKVILTGNSVVDSDVLTDVPVSDFKIFPVPASEYLTLQSDSSFENLTCEIIDMTGRKILEINLDNNFPGEYTLNISSLRQGIYTLVMHSDYKNETLKFLIIK